ncbi:septin-9-like [Megalops cyprinoides]|uniref:septin-9-like n=1 Tax=Megalops cyprinoides TaxID=118141 RepID=UPI001864AD7E|nr:septin-9-like [Megalops cyprinoides]
MSDAAVNAQLEGIISDFEALKRSFEVEEADTSAHPSSHGRRTPNLRMAFSASSHHFQEPGARNSEPIPRPTAEHSPKAGLRRMELAGGRIPESVSRRTEISIDILSKQVDSSPSPGISRFGLKRPEVLSHSRILDSSFRRSPFKRR